MSVNGLLALVLGAMGSECLANGEILVHPYIVTRSWEPPTDDHQLIPYIQYRRH